MHKCFCGQFAPHLFTAPNGQALTWLCDACFSYWTMVKDLRDWAYGK